MLYYSNLFAVGSPNKIAIEGKKAVLLNTTVQELSQSIATALTFGCTVFIRLTAQGAY